METIGKQTIRSFVLGSDELQKMTCTQVRKSPGYRVGSYLELASRVAALQFQNRGFVLLFRGQSGDYKNQQKNTMLKPSLFRGKTHSSPSSGTIRKRFNSLEMAEQLLISSYESRGYPGLTLVKRNQVVRWSIIQHYEICETPLLDVTQSLRIAASFASHKAEQEAYVFVIGVPNLSGAITSSVEAGLQIIRLASICPPVAIRPHIQEGFLLCEYPELYGYEQKQLFDHHEIDFGRRLIAKFQFDPRGLPDVLYQ